MSNEHNAREELALAAEWLGWQDENLSFGLKSAEHALKLWRYWQAHPELPEMADSDYDDEGKLVGPKNRRKALGYDPMRRALSAIEA